MQVPKPSIKVLVVLWAFALPVWGAPGDPCQATSDCADDEVCTEQQCVSQQCTDHDADGLCDGADNCPDRWNPDQADEDGDNIGDACDWCVGPGTDVDRDGICDNVAAHCRNSSQDATETDFNCGGSGCSPCKVDQHCNGHSDCVTGHCDAGVCTTGACWDADKDGVCHDVDNCDDHWNPNQADKDGDNIGDACDWCDGPGVDANRNGICDGSPDEPEQFPTPLGLIDEGQLLHDDVWMTSEIPPYAPSAGAAPAVKSLSGAPSKQAMFAAANPFGWPQAPAWLGVTHYTPRENKVVLHVPEFAGAKDYRVYRLYRGARVQVHPDGRQSVHDETVVCAGERQYNAPASENKQVMRDIEINDISGATMLVIEAIDRQCPFVGVVGEQPIKLRTMNQDVPDDQRPIFPIVTPEAVKERYGALIINGQGPAENLAQPADPEPAHVLARTVVAVWPDAEAQPRTTALFDNFENPNFSPVLRGFGSGAERAQSGPVEQNPFWSFYSHGVVYADSFIRNGQLHTILSDWGQDVFGSLMFYPRRTVQLSNDTYLHVTFEVSTSPTPRRYWLMTLCGADTMGQTLDERGLLKEPLVQTPFFYQPDGLNVSTAGWNCLQLFPRDGWPIGMEGGRPQTDIRVMVNRPGDMGRDSVVNVSPHHGRNALAPPGWYHRQDANGNYAGPLLDDLLRHAPKIRYDLFIRRDQVIMFAEGEQVLCNNFGDVPLTMAEGALGLGQVLYHSTAERIQMTREDWDRTGQRHYYHNVPYVDHRKWDNVGFDEGVLPPASFDPSVCYTPPASQTATAATATTAAATP